MRPYSLLPALLVALLAAPLHADEPSPLSERLAKFVEAGQISGAVGLVMRDGKVVYHDAVGLADIESKRHTTRYLHAAPVLVEPVAELPH